MSQCADCNKDTNELTEVEIQGKTAVVCDSCLEDGYTWVGDKFISLDEI